MARKNHPGRRASGTTSDKWHRQAPAGRDISRILDPAPRLERDRYGDWLVQYIPAVKKPTPAPNATARFRPEQRIWWCGKKATRWAVAAPLTSAGTGISIAGASAANRLNTALEVQPKTTFLTKTTFSNPFLEGTQ